MTSRSYLPRLVSCEDGFAGGEEAADRLTLPPFVPLSFAIFSALSLIDDFARGECKDV